MLCIKNNNVLPGDFFGNPVRYNVFGAGFICVEVYL